MLIGFERRERGEAEPELERREGGGRRCRGSQGIESERERKWRRQRWMPGRMTCDGVAAGEQGKGVGKGAREGGAGQ